jgi:hypothetical protein
MTVSNVGKHALVALAILGGVLALAIPGNVMAQFPPGSNSRSVVQEYSGSLSGHETAESLSAHAQQSTYLWLGPYASLAQANAAGELTLALGWSSYAAGYQPSDPTGAGGGPGIYLLLQYNP